MTGGEGFTSDALSQHFSASFSTFGPKDKNMTYAEIAEISGWQ